MKAWKYVLLLIAFIPLLYFRDFTPNNELKYLSIADEAIQNKTFLTFYNHEQIYADKPPLYFWIIMAGKSLLGFHSMLFISLFSLLPALLILYILNRWLSPYTDKKNLQTCNLMLITSGLFMGFGHGITYGYADVPFYIARTPYILQNLHRPGIPPG